MEGERSRWASLSVSKGMMAVSESGHRKDEKEGVKRKKEKRKKKNEMLMIEHTQGRGYKGELCLLTLVSNIFSLWHPRARDGEEGR